MQSPNILPQFIPLELLLFSEPKVSAFIGSRTSALHVAKALCPEIVCTYFDRADTEDGKRWIKFMERIGIPPSSKFIK